MALFSLALAALLTGRVTRSLGRLTTAAEAVARGELERRVEDVGDDEVGRVGRAFNAMTESLRRTLRELADRQALAAVGEFAASLSHEIRNALTSIRVDLQLLDEETPEDASAPEIRNRALQKVTHLNRTVSDALSLARSGRVGQDNVDLCATLQSAAQSATSEFEERGAKLQSPSAASRPIEVRGDRGALEQLFLNLLALAALHVWRRPLPQVLREYVMDPIGASNTWRWHGYDNSWVLIDGLKVQSVSGGGHWGGGRWISARDQARFGLLTLRRGRWKDQQILSEEWVEMALTPGPANPGYGFMNWFLNTDMERIPGAPESTFCHLGAGTNMVCAIPEYDLVVVARWINGRAANSFVRRVLESVVTGAGDE